VRQTLPVALVMLEAIRDVHEETGRIVGFKPAGGIRNAKQAVQNLVLVHETVGTDWLTPDLYRLGASSLLNDVLMQIRKERTGAYEARTSSRLTEVEHRKSATPAPTSWDYAPAPESRDIVTLRERYGHFVGGEWLEPRETYTTISPSSEEPLAEVGQATAEEVDLAVRAARDAFANGWSELAGSERAKYLFRIARILQERSREFAVLESLNGGKPIKESRDVDLPLAAAHFFYYAGWADKLDYAFRTGSRRRRRRRADHPVELPTAHARVEDRAGARMRNTVVLKPAETTPLTALLFCDVVRQAELPPGVVNIVTGDGAPARRLSRTTAWTRSRSPGRPRSARRSSASSPARRSD
jgi:hypothetical protein